LLILNGNDIKNSSLYIGRVKHHRLKGGAMHALNYPLCFSYIDLEEINQLGSIMWPIFGSNYGWFSLCSFDHHHHLKEWDNNNNITTAVTSSSSLYNKVISFINNKTNGSISYNDSNKPKICLMTHLTYLGYCFNPVSFYYIYGSNSSSSSTSSSSTSTTASSSSLQCMIAEVANTPWIEQHSYMLHESVKGVDIIRKTEISSDTSNNDNDTHDIFEASWDKEFHVSPFMEMDYRYTFTFSEPKDHVWVRSKMVKRNTNDIWFTASFEMKRIPFTALNVLYILFCYPIYTRIIQLWIHIEAMKIAIKGVPLFGHPNGTDVDFGFGITGDRKSTRLNSSH
jgi:DUF1365 family protein